MALISQDRPRGLVGGKIGSFPFLRLFCLKLMLFASVSPTPWAIAVILVHLQLFLKTKCSVHCWGQESCFLLSFLLFPFFILFPTFFPFLPSFPPLSLSYMPVSEALKCHPGSPSVGVASLEYKRFSVLSWTFQYNSFIGSHIHTLISAFDICKVCSFKTWFFMCMGVLPAGISVSHSHARCPQRAEENIGLYGTGTGVTGVCELSCGFWELNSGTLEEKPVILTEPLNSNEQWRKGLSPMLGYWAVL